MRAFFLCFLICSLCAAEEAQPWPKSTGQKIEFVDTEATRLPPGLRFDSVTVEGREPHTIGLSWVDLNKDGIPELVVDTHEGGTGGTYIHIFKKTRSGFRNIAGLQGGIDLVTPKNGYYQIESWSSGGGGMYSRVLFRYIRGRYRMVRLEDWRGNDTKEGFEFVRSRDPKEYDK